MSPENSDPAAPVTPPEQVIAFFAARGKTVLTFTGYSGAGYEDPDAMLRDAATVLDDYAAATTIVNIGVTAEGIGAVYALASSRGYETTGIVSVLAAKNGAAVSPDVDHAFFVADPTWGGRVKETGELSVTSRLIVQISDVLVGIGGGPIGRDELLAARQAGKSVIFFPADMNHRNAAAGARRAADQPPPNLAGAAHEAFAADSTGAREES